MKAYYSCHGTLYYKTFDKVVKAIEFMEYMKGECKVFPMCITDGEGELEWFNDFFMEQEINNQLRIIMKTAVEDKIC